MSQYGFFFDQSRCTGCHACAVACKNWHRLPPGPLKFLRVYQFESGSFPDVRLRFQWIPCYHCETPPCVAACPAGAIAKEAKFGAVLIAEESCNGCRACYAACPFGAPVFEDGEAGAKARKCTMCIDRLQSGLQPICASACPQRALDFGPMADLAARYPEAEVSDLPGSAPARPAILVKPPAQKRAIVKYDAKKALGLMMRRDPLPPLFSAIEEATVITEGLVGRGELVMKHDSVEDLMRRTQNDDG